MKSVSSLLLILAFVGYAYCTCSATVTQTIQNQWISNGVPFYQYDITIMNTGTESYTAYPGFILATSDGVSRVLIPQTWGLTVYANTPPYTTLEVGAIFGSPLGPGTTYQAGYIAANVTINLTHITYQCASSNMPTSMPSSMPTSMPSSMPTAMPTNMPSSMPTNMPSSMPTNMPSSMPTNMPSSMPTNMPSSMPTSSPSCSVTVTQTVRTSWTTDGVQFYLYDLTISNMGTTAATGPSFLISTSTPPLSLQSTWNLIVYANTPPYANNLVSPLPSSKNPFVLQAGQVYTSAGYISTSITTLGAVSCA